MWNWNNNVEWICPRFVELMKSLKLHVARHFFRHLLNRFCVPKVTLYIIIGLMRSVRLKNKEHHTFLLPYSIFRYCIWAWFEAPDLRLYVWHCCRRRHVAIQNICIYLVSRWVCLSCCIGLPTCHSCWLWQDTWVASTRARRVPRWVRLEIENFVTTIYIISLRWGFFFLLL